MTENENEKVLVKKDDIKSKVVGTLGISSSGLGVFGVVHNICHYTCQGVIALLLVFGISVVGMPLGFLLDPYIVVIFSSIGLASITLSIVLRAKHKKKLSFCVVSGNTPTMTRRIRDFIADRKLIIFFVFGVISVGSFVSAVNDILVKENDAKGAALVGPTEDISELTVDSSTKTNSEGDTNIAITYQGVSNEGMVFTVSMDTNNMESLSLAQYDLTKLSYIIDGSTGNKAMPVSWYVQETGHMGHHLKGILVFPLKEENSSFIIYEQTKSFKIVIDDIAGVKQRVFSWEVIA